MGTEQKTIRLETLDYLRGLAAFGIMIYHYMKWLYIYQGANSAVGRVSVYGVETFYVLSGITLFYVYQSNFNERLNNVNTFYLTRFFRIYPLFWVATLASLIWHLKPEHPFKLFLNFSGLFGFVAWDKGIATGVWSIGNELFYYLFFPFLVWLFYQRKSIFFTIGFVLIMVHIYFAYSVFNPADTLHNQWSSFVNPLNHFLFFYLGMCIPMGLEKFRGHNVLAILMLAVGIWLLFIPETGDDEIFLLAGYHRLLFTLAVMLICTGFYCFSGKLPDIISKPFSTLGIISYSVYLLHPFIYHLLAMAIRQADNYGYFFPRSNLMFITVASLTTLVVSYFVFHYFELFFIKKGKKLRP
ncbi:MAG: acyltransferase [Bacteroidia bacterium]|nr:acyltransferase [Bacteroidia bacterium]MCZ2249421.1 acyltransferase [Bacteroidia bacterium]